MFGLGILKGTIIGLGIGVIASFALKEAVSYTHLRAHETR